MNCHFLIQYELLPAAWPQTGYNALSNITYMYRIAFKTYFLRFCNFIHVLVKKKLLPTNFLQYFYIEITRKSSALGWTNRRTVLIFKSFSENAKIGFYLQLSWENTILKILQFHCFHKGGSYFALEISDLSSVNAQYLLLLFWTCIIHSLYKGLLISFVEKFFKLLIFWKFSLFSKKVQECSFSRKKVCVKKNERFKKKIKKWRKSRER